jgi:hypothetical protein
MITETQIFEAGLYSGRPSARDCPFCMGSKNDLIARIKDPVVRVYCRNCASLGPYGADVPDAIRKWNGTNAFGGQFFPDGVDLSEHAK